MNTQPFRNDEIRGSSNDPQPPPPRRPAVETSRLRDVLGDARALGARLADLVSQRDRELDGLQSRAADLRESAFARRDSEIREKYRAAAEQMTAQLERLRGFAAAQLGWHSPEGRLRTARFEDGAAELAFARRVERAPLGLLEQLARDAYDDGSLPRLRVIGEEAVARGGEAEMRLAPLVAEFAAALVESSDGDAALVRQLAEAVRLAGNDHARLTGRRLQLSEEEIAALSQEAYAELRRSGLL